MFVRFRETKRRLQVSLIATSRITGKVHHEHIASLGSVPSMQGVADRVEFWQALHEKLGRLSNRVGGEDVGRILGSVHARIPMVTPAEQRELQLENAEADKRFWETMRSTHAEQAVGFDGLAENARVSKRVAEDAAANAKEGVDTAAQRIERLKKGEAVAGRLRPMTRQQLLAALGWTAADVRHATVIREIYRLGGEAEFIATATDEWTKRAAARRVLRRLKDRL